MIKKVYKNFKENKKKILSWLIIFGVVIFIVIYYYTITVPYVSHLAEETVSVKSINIINQTNKKIQRLRAFYGNLFEFVRNDEGDITLIESNHALINQITMLANAEIQNALNELHEQKLNIPAGAFTGSALLAGVGFNVPITIVSIGKCNNKFNSNFYAVGINHAVHKLVLDVFVDIKVLVPWRAQDVRVKYEILLAENLIVGQIPSTYLSGESFDPNYIDLIPDYN